MSLKDIFNYKQVGALTVITYQEEEYSVELWLEMYPLLLAHAEEVSIFNYPLSPCRLQYDKLAENNSLIVYTARDDKKLVGYMIYIIYNHLHYNVPTASQDILYLDPDFRKGMSGVKLIRQGEVLLKDKYKIKLVLQHTKFHKALDPLFLRLGYKECDRLYSKEI